MPKTSAEISNELAGLCCEDYWMFFKKKWYSEEEVKEILNEPTFIMMFKEKWGLK